MQIRGLANIFKILSKSPSYPLPDASITNLLASSFYTTSDLQSPLPTQAFYLQLSMIGVYGFSSVKDVRAHMMRSVIGSECEVSWHAIQPNFPPLEGKKAHIIPSLPVIPLDPHINDHY